jgi:hypothetical protein
VGQITSGEIAFAFGGRGLNKEAAPADLAKRGFE